MTRRPTLADVARRAGVSTATASKVLNRRTGFSAETAAAVQAAMSELGYLPITRERMPRATGSIVAVFDTLYTLYSLRVIEGIAEGAQVAGVELVTQVSDPGHVGAPTLSLDERRVRSMADRGHAGVIMVTSRIPADLVDLLRAYGLPLVSIDASAALQADVPDVSSTHWRGGQQAAAHLLERGHRRIAFFGAEPANPGIRERLAGFRDVLAEAGAPLDERFVVTGLHADATALGALLRQDDRPTAVFAATDAAAVGTIAVARGLGLRVPDDLSVVGYDDTYAPVVPGLDLTTVHAPLEALGRTAVETVLALAAGRPAPRGDLHLSTRLIVRGTTAAAPTG